MSQATDTVIKQQEGLFSKKNRKLINDPLNDNNPITVQVLGICSALAVTTQVKPALVMAISVVFVLAFANLFISLLRNTIPSKIRMIVQLTVIASLVTVVDQVLHAFNYSVYKELTVFIGLIITNCIIMGRLEAFAMANRPWQSFLDGIGNAFGYGAILLMVAFCRELFGSGSLFGFNLFGQKAGSLAANGEILANSTGLYALGYVDNGVMLTPAAAMFIIGVIIWIQRSQNKKLVDVS